MHPQTSLKLKKMETEKKRDNPSYAFINPNMIKAIGVQLTNKCNLMCKHCGANSSPSGEYGPSIDWIFGLIKAIANDTSIDTIMVTGGEPFLRYNDLLLLTKKCSEYALKTEVVSNGFWGYNFELSKRYVHEMTEAGLFQITLSVDRIHQEYIEEKSIENICKAIQQSADNILLRIYTLDGGLCNYHLINSLEKTYTGINMQIFSQPLLPLGRAQQNRKTLNIESSLISESDNHPCHLVLFPFIDSNRNWFMCSNSSVLGDISPFCLGKLTDPNCINSFICRQLNSDLCRFMRNIGPIELFNLIEPEYSTERHVSVCDLCLQSFSKKHIAEKIAKALHSHQIVEALDYIDEELRANV